MNLVNGVLVVESFGVFDFSPLYHLIIIACSPFFYLSLPYRSFIICWGLGFSGVGFSYGFPITLLKYIY